MGAYTQTEQVAHEIADLIRSGELRPGQKIMSEARLAEQYHVSRGTVRRALAQLKETNLIETRMGSGSFVSFNGRALSQLDSWTVSTLESGTPTHTQLVSLDFITRPAFLDAASSEPNFYRIVRTRISQNVPVSLERSYLPATDELRAIITAHNGLINGSIHATAKAAGLRATHSSFTVTARALGSDATPLLRGESEVFLFTQRHNFNADNQLVEYVESLLDPQHFSIHVDADKPKEH